MKPIVRDANLSQAFKTGWQLYKENFGFILGVTLVAGLVSAVTCGICAGPMSCGAYAVLLALLRKREPKPQFGELFSAGFAKFAPAFVALLALWAADVALNVVLPLVPIAGHLAGCAVSFVASGVIAWSMLLVADQNATIGEAISEPFQCFKDNRFWMFVLIVFLGGLVAAAGLLLCFVGVFFTGPFAYCVTVAAYEQMTGGGEGVPPPAAAPVPPPPAAPAAPAEPVPEPPPAPEA